MNDNSPDSPKAFRYSLELVARIAATLLQDARSGEPTDKRLDAAAELSVKLLDACRFVLFKDRNCAEQLQRERTANLEVTSSQREALQAVEEKYPNGLSGRQYLLFVTHKRSQGEALKPFKLWRRHYLKVLRAEYGVSRTPAELDNEVEHEVKWIRRHSHKSNKLYECEEALRDRENFRTWYALTHIPQERSAAGQKGVQKRQNKHL